jgi:hypothetical protein
VKTPLDEAAAGSVREIRIGRLSIDAGLGVNTAVSAAEISQSLVVRLSGDTTSFVSRSDLIGAIAESITSSLNNNKRFNDTAVRRRAKPNA